MAVFVLITVQAHGEPPLEFMESDFMVDAYTNRIYGITAPVERGTGPNVTRLLAGDIPGHECSDINESEIPNVWIVNCRVTLAGVFVVLQYQFRWEPDVNVTRMIIIDMSTDEEFPYYQLSRLLDAETDR